jgi:hypothetical protein
LELAILAWAWVQLEALSSVLELEAGLEAGGQDVGVEVAQGFELWPLVLFLVSAFSLAGLWLRLAVFAAVPMRTRRYR